MLRFIFIYITIYVIHFDILAREPNLLGRPELGEILRRATGQMAPGYA